MKDWKVRQKIFHQIYQNKDLGDNLANQTVVEEFDSKDIVKRAIEYPVKQSKTLFYPGKSYAIAIIYAKLLEIHFNEDFLTCLNDKDLLYNNDKYFKAYKLDKETYDLIINKFPFEVILNESEYCSSNFIKTYNYFLKEFLLHDETKIYLPS